MQCKLYILVCVSFVVCIVHMIPAAQQINKPNAPQSQVTSESETKTTQADATAKPTVLENDELLFAEDETTKEDQDEQEKTATEEEPSEESTEETPIEEGTSEKEEASEEESEEETPSEEETETEEEESEHEKPKGFVSKWEDIGFDFDELEVAPLATGEKEQAEKKMPEILDLDIDFEGISDAELNYVNIQKDVKKTEGLLLQLPIVGDVVLAPIMINGEYGYQFKSASGGRTINAGILVIDTYSVTLVGQEISFVGEGSLLGKKGKLHLRNVTSGGLIPVTPAMSKVLSITSPKSSETETKPETKGSLEQMVFAFEYDNPDRPKITIFNMGEITLESTNIIFQKDKPVLVVGTAYIFGVQAEVGLALTKVRVNAFINVQGRAREECKDATLKDTPACQDLQFEDVIPQIAKIDQSIGKSRLKDLILKISNLIVLKPQQRLTKESMDSDQLQGLLTATLNLAGTDLASNPDLIVKAVSAQRALQKTPSKEPEKSPLEAQIEIKFDKYSYTGEMSAAMLYIKNVGKIESPVITTSIDRSGGSVEGSIKITGTLILSLQEIGILRVSPVEIELNNQGLVVSGSVPEINYKKLQLKDLDLRFDSASRSLVLSCTKAFGDFELKIDLTLVKAESGDESSKGEIEFKARLVTTTRCLQNEYTCVQQALAACKASETDKKNQIQKKEQQLKAQELQAIALGVQGKEQEADAAWKAWDTLAEDIFKQKEDLRDCTLKAREKCMTDRNDCQQKQLLARQQASSRIEVRQVREELAQGKEKKPEGQVAVEEISFYPFKTIPGIPREIQDIKLSNIDIGLEFKRDQEGSSAGSLYFSGNVNAFGVVVPGKLRFIYEGENKDGIVLTLNFDQRTTLEKLLPFALKGAPYNTIYLENTKVIISNVKSQIKAFGELEKGIQISGSVPLSGGLEDVGKLLGKEGKVFSLLGTINLNDMRKSKIEIAILKDTQGLTIQEKCQKEALDCMKNVEKSCASGDKNNQLACKEKGKAECSNNQVICEKEINDIIRLNVVSVVIGFEPSFKVKAGLTFRPPAQKDKPIEFYGQINFGVKDAEIDAYMQGTWQDAFTLKGWEISDLAIKVGQAYGSPTPSKFGGAGRIKIVGKSLVKAVESWGQQAASWSVVTDAKKELASKPIFQGKSAEEANQVLQATANAVNKTVSYIDLSMDAALVADAGLTDVALEFKTSKVITWLELLLVFCGSFFDSVKNNELVAKLKFIDTLLLKVSNLTGSYAARDIHVGAKTIPRGMSFGCIVDLYGKQGRLKMQLRDDGLEGLATFDKIDTPYFKLTGAGEDKILGTADDAPIMRVALNILNQEFYIDGQVELIIPQLGTIKSVTRINIGFDELRFLTQGNVFNLFAADLEAHIGSDVKNIYIKGKLQNNALTQLEQLLKKAAKSLNEQARKDIGFAKQQVQTLSSREIVLAGRKSLAQAQQNVKQSLVELNGVKVRLDNAVKSCGR